jgi:hypothetical protein
MSIYLCAVSYKDRQRRFGEISCLLLRSPNVKMSRAGFAKKNYMASIYQIHCVTNNKTVFFCIGYLLMDMLTSHLIHSHTHSLTHTLTHSPTHSLTHPVTHSLTHSVTHSPNHSLCHSITHPPTHSLIHSLTHSIVLR